MNGFGREIERIYRQFEQFSKVLDVELADLIRVSNLAASQFAKVHSDLAKIADALAPIQSQVAGVARSVSESFQFRIDAGALHEMLKQGLPPNWAEAESVRAAGDVVEMMQETGWCLVWCPRGAVIDELLDASDLDERTQILLDSLERVVDDLRSCLATIKESELADLKAVALRAIDAFIDGHSEAAQALSSSCISALINDVLESSFGRIHSEFLPDPMDQPWTEFRRWTVLHMVALSLKRYRAEKGDPVPGVYSRHASAHSISPQQYTRTNSLASLLLLVAFLKELSLVLDEIRNSSASPGNGTGG